MNQIIQSCNFFFLYIEKSNHLKIVFKWCPCQRDQLFNNTLKHTHIKLLLKEASMFSNQEIPTSIADLPYHCIPVMLKLQILFRKVNPSIILISDVGMFVSGINK